MGSSDSPIYVVGLQGHIDWKSPITNVRVIDKVNKIEVPSKLIDKSSNGFTLKIADGTSTQYLEWIIVWYDKSL